MSPVVIAVGAVGLFLVLVVASYNRFVHQRQLIPAGRLRLHQVSRRQHPLGQAAGSQA